MTINTTESILNTFHSYIRNSFYNKLNYDDSRIHIYYNSFVYDILAVIPYENKELIDTVRSFSDYIVLIEDATEKIEYPDSEIGLIYVDSQKNLPGESIVIARLPLVQIVSNEKRKEILELSLGGEFYKPFWVNYTNKETRMDRTNEKDLHKAKELIERAINNYCKKNNISRDIIVNYPMFIEYIAPEIFKQKISVEEEVKIRKEAEDIDTSYPDRLLKILLELGYLK